MNCPGPHFRKPETRGRKARGFYVACAGQPRFLKRGWAPFCFCSLCTAVGAVATVNRTFFPIQRAVGIIKKNRRRHPLWISIALAVPTACFGFDVLFGLAWLINAPTDCRADFYPCR